MDDVYAASSRKKQATLWNTSVAALAQFGIEPLPPTREKLIFLGAALKAGRYTTANLYLNHYKVRCEREGHILDASLQRVYLDVVR